MKSSRRKAFLYRGVRCLNCGHALKRTDVYCSQCAQLNSNKPLSAGDFLTEFVSSILVYDSRIRTTLRDLIFKPGVITRNYVCGQRVKYANPFRFFLSVSIIFFLLRSAISFFGFSDTPNFLNINLKPNISPADTEMVDSVMTTVSNRNKTTFFNDSIFANKLGIPTYFPENALDTLSFYRRSKKKMKLFESYFLKHREEYSGKALINLNYTNGFVNSWLYSRAVSQDKLQNDPGAFVNYILTKTPFFLFFFTPFFALAFLIFYPGKKFSFIEHMIFIFHIFSFVFLSLICFTILDLLIGTLFFTKLLFLLIGPVYFFLALFNFYGQSIKMTFVKFLVLSFVFAASFGTSVFLFVIAGVAVY